MSQVDFEPLFGGGEQPPLCLTGTRLAQLAHVTYFAATTYTSDALLRLQACARAAAPPRPLLAPDSQTLGPREPSRLARWFGMDPGITGMAQTPSCTRVWQAVPLRVARFDSVTNLALQPSGLLPGSLTGASCPCGMRLRWSGMSPETPPAAPCWPPRKVYIPTFYMSYTFSRPDWRRSQRQRGSVRSIGSLSSLMRRNCSLNSSTSSGERVPPLICGQPWGRSRITTRHIRIAFRRASGGR